MSRAAQTAQSGVQRAPSTSPIHRYGGKGHIARRLAKLLAPHTRFVEVFGGSGAVLTAKPPSPSEVWNDLDYDLYNCFRVIKDRRLRARLVEMIEFTPHSRGQFVACLRELENGAFESRSRRAWAFVVVANQGRDGGGVIPSYSYSRLGVGRKRARDVVTWNRLPQRIAELGARLERVVVLNEPFEQVLLKYDSPETMFLIDPPYHPDTRKHKQMYLHELDAAGHLRLLSMVKRLSGQCLVCGHPHELYDSMLEGWRRLEMTVPMYAGPRTGRRCPVRTEAVWLNYDPPGT